MQREITINAESASSRPDFLRRTLLVTLIADTGDILNQISADEIAACIGPAILDAIGEQAALAHFADQRRLAA